MNVGAGGSETKFFDVKSTPMAVVPFGAPQLQSPFNQPADTVPPLLVPSLAELEDKPSVIAASPVQRAYWQKLPSPRPVPPVALGALHVQRPFANTAFSSFAQRVIQH